MRIKEQVSVLRTVLTWNMSLKNHGVTLYLMWPADWVQTLGTWHLNKGTIIWADLDLYPS